MIFLPFNESFLPQASKLAQEQYLRERLYCSALPDQMPFFPLEKTLKDTKDGIGFAAVTDNETLAGYLFFPWVNLNGFFGNCTGAYSPLHCYAVRDTSSLKGGMSREKTVSMLFQKCAENLVQKSNTSISLTVYAHDTEMIDALVLNGCGIRCADALRDSSVPLRKDIGDKKYELPAGFSFAIVDGGELTSEKELTAQFTALFNILIRHLVSSPVFFTKRPYSVEDFASRCTKRSGRFFTVFSETGNGQQLAGYMEVYSGGENFISGNLALSRELQHICGAVIRPEYRGLLPGYGGTVAECLLEQVRRTVFSEGSRLLGVDCETLNPNARYFWGKYFTNYTYSLHRRIDERTVPCKIPMESLRN